jgi:hypothetical protein
MSRSPHPPWFNQPNNIRWRIQAVKFIMLSYFTPALLLCNVLTIIPISFPFLILLSVEKYLARKMTAHLNHCHHFHTFPDVEKLPFLKTQLGNDKIRL